MSTRVASPTVDRPARRDSADRRRHGSGFALSGLQEETGNSTPRRTPPRRRGIGSNKTKRSPLFLESRPSSEVGGVPKGMPPISLLIAAAFCRRTFLTIVKHQLDRYNASEAGVPFAETLRAAQSWRKI